MTWIWSWIPVIVVVGLVLSYCVRCRHLIYRTGNPRDRLGKLREELKSDIRALVTSGRSLDWVHYADEAHRGQEDLREHLRNYGTISLATGVGGTMLALAIALWDLRSNGSSPDLNALLREMPLALFASVAGVLGNLAILWGLLPLANREFNPKLDRFLKALRKEETECAARHPAGPTTAHVLGDGIGEELRAAIARVPPELFKQLDATAATLGEAAEKLGEDVAALTSASDRLARSTDGLSGLPTELDTALAKALQGLSGEAETLRRALVSSHESLQNSVELAGTRHGEAANTLSRTAHSMADAVNDAAQQLAMPAQAVADSAEALPDRVAEAVSDATATLSESTLAVRQSVEALPDRVATAVNGAAQQLATPAQAVADAARTLPDRVATAVNDATASLSESTNAVRQAVEALPDRVGAAMNDATASLSESTWAVRQAVETLPDRVGTAVNDATASLAEGTTAVRQTVEALPDRIGASVDASGELLGRRLSDAVEPHVTGLRDALTAGLSMIVEWQNSVSGHLEEARRQHERVLHDLVARTADVATGVHDLPDSLAKGIGEVSDRIGSRFGHEAREHVADLRSAMEEDRARLRSDLERHESHLLNTTVQELRRVSEELINTTVSDLAGTSEKMAAVLDGFPDHVAAVSSRLDDAEAELKVLLAGFAQASSGLRDAHDQTGDLLDRLVGSAEKQADAIRELTDAIQTVGSPWWRLLGRRSASTRNGAARTSRNRRWQRLFRRRADSAGEQTEEQADATPPSTEATDRGRNPWWKRPFRRRAERREAREAKKAQREADPGAAHQQEDS